MIRTTTLALLLVVTACGGRSAPPAAPPAAADAGALLGALSADSMEGRGTATRGGDRAATFIAERMQEYGLVPAGDSGWFQRAPSGPVVTARGASRRSARRRRPRPRCAASTSSA